MASWLKVAEDLLEVVDRRAKLVVSELSDEQTDPQASASDSQDGQIKKTKSTEKNKLKLARTEKPKTISDEQERKRKQVVPSRIKIEKLKPPSSKQALDVTSESATSPDGDKVAAESAFEHDKVRNASKEAIEVSFTGHKVENAASSANEEAVDESSKQEVPVSTPQIVDKGTGAINDDQSTDVDSTFSSTDIEPSSTNEEKSEAVTIEKQNTSNSQETKAETLPDPPSITTNHREDKSGSSSMKVEDQLDEAQGLLKTAVKTGQSKEARLARICAGLSSRLQEHKSENAQLEELLVHEREKCSSYEAHIKQLQLELSISRTEAARAESNMADALAAKNSEIEALVTSLDSLKKQTAASEGKLASLQAEMESLRRNRELTETRVMQALREELASAERRAEEERAAHNATKMAAVEREVELEHRAVEASNALARIQRAADESSSRAMELEHKVALLEVECASLHQELQDLEARSRRAQKKPSEEANQVLQMQAWQEEVERARQGQREAENKISYLEAELQKMRVEMAGMKRDAEHYSRQEHMELEKRYRELTDLLYHKQTQLESMASEKAALEFQLEKELKRFQDIQLESERSRVARRALSSWEEDTDIKALEPLPLHHRHMAVANRQINKAAKLLDSGAVRATRFLWRYPVARVCLLFYLVFVHLFLMYLLHRLQEQADNLASREVAASMGLTNSSLLP